MTSWRQMPAKSPLSALAALLAAAAASPHWPAPQADNLAPKFSWDTMGGMVFMQLCNPNATLEAPGYPASVMRTLAKYPLVTLEKCVGTFTSGYEEDKVVASCAALKALNPEISCVFYLNTELDFTGFRLYDDFERHPEYWLLTPNGSAPVRQHGPAWGCTGGVCPASGLKLADFSVPDAAAFWLIACANVTAHKSVDGCNLDRASHLGRFTALPSSGWAPRNGGQAFNDGKLAAFQKLQSIVGAGPVIANCHSCLTDSTTVPGVASQNLEGFNVAEEWIEKMQVLARHRKLAKAHYSVNDDGGAGCLNATLVEPAMATFLIGAGENAFFSCAHGWTGKGADGESIAPWVAWLTQYDKPLGKPLGLGSKGTDGVWRRNFTSGTAVWFDGATSSTQICWEGKGSDGGPCPPFKPAPPAPPVPPAPPAPASCGIVRGDTGVSGAGSDLRPLEKQVESAAECCAWCQAHSHLPRDARMGCVFWAWHAEQGNTCHLHTAGGKFSHKEGCFSGRLANATHGQA
eukprot:COSAG05_NODE_1329_length_5159_cov_5.257510_2_plen_518_part_00